MDILEKTNEDVRMVAGYHFTGGDLWAWHHWEIRQRGIRVTALSTSRKIPTQ
ncbi:hypothetical protein ATANTOWER_011151, partial [Ataeniobius toweri]|nr:hypothetical protein [Ataeniobius toweri]